MGGRSLRSFYTRARVYLLRRRSPSPGSAAEPAWARSAGILTDAGNVAAPALLLASADVSSTRTHQKVGSLAESAERAGQTDEEVRAAADSCAGFTFCSGTSVHH